MNGLTPEQSAYLDTWLRSQPPYWHAMPADMAGWFRWNTSRKFGLAACAAMCRENLPEGVLIDASMTVASMRKPGWKEREDFWEAIRQKEFPERPSRLGAWYVFDELSSFDKAQSKLGWFQNREIFEVRIFPASKVFRADMNLIGGNNEAEWKGRARRYWSGELASDALVEVVVWGMLYFLDWDSAKFKQPPFLPPTPAE